MNKVFKVAMFFTAFIPLWITVLFLDIMSICDRTNGYIGSEVIGIGCIIAGLLLSAIIIFCSMRGVKESDYAKYKILSVEQEKGITSEFLLSYILPLFAFDFTKWVSVVEFSIYFLILAFLCVRNNNVYANLLLEVRKYKFYTCEMQWMAEVDATPIPMTVISKKPLTAHKGNTIEVAALNKPFYLGK
ncbi:MAG: hypothetical protein ACLUAY_00470 [Butyricicoccus sp.]